MKPYYVDESVTLYHGRWENLIDPGLTVDLILTDPPYGETSLSWDRWLEGWPSLAARHSRSMWCWGSMRMFLDHRAEFDRWSFSQDVVWEKHNGSNLASDRFARVHENVTFWYQGPWGDIYHDTPKTLDATARTIRKKARPAQWTGATGATTYSSSDGGPRIMRSVIYGRSMHGRAINETEKPGPFLESLITYGCPPGGTVLDVFAGSCSTGVAARATGRKAILFEEREDQCEKAALRFTQGIFDYTGEAS